MNNYNYVYNYIIWAGFTRLIREQLADLLGRFPQDGS